MPIIGITASSITPTLQGDYESIATVQVTASGGVTEVNFTNIPTTYKHLQIRGIWKPRTVGAWSFMRFGNAGNIEATAVYSYHNVYGNGATVTVEATSGGGANTTHLCYVNNTTYYGSFVMDILDYTDTNKYKTSRGLWGYDANGSGFTGLVSNNWRSFNAITDIRVWVETANNISQYSHFALYGIKG